MRHNMDGGWIGWFPSCWGPFSSFSVRGGDRHRAPQSATLTILGGIRSDLSGAVMRRLLS